MHKTARLTLVVFRVALFLFLQARDFNLSRVQVMRNSHTGLVRFSISSWGFTPPPNSDLEHIRGTGSAVQILVTTGIRTARRTARSFGAAVAVHCSQATTPRTVSDRGQEVTAEASVSQVATLGGIGQSAPYGLVLPSLRPGSRRDPYAS